MTDVPAVRALVRGQRPLHRTIRTRPAAVQGTLALQWQLPGELDAEPVPAASLRLVTRTPADDDTDPVVAEVPTSRAHLPEPGTWTAQLVQAVLEVLAHERPRHQLVRWLAPEVYADLGVHLAARPAGRPAPRARRTVSSIHVFEPADGVAEATAVVVGGARARAMALRLEGWDGRWRCTRLALL
ncbi:MAG TPA: Rv3235 family protein [Candidatus Nanopelagicales bacterium]|nr:Rv3235 family protein [Candidatus Nanopelagicales bacterium]